MVLQVGESFFGVAGSVDGGTVGEDDLAGFVHDKCFSAGHEELPGDAEGGKDGVGRVAEEGIGELVVLLELFVAVYGAAVDSDDDGAGLYEVGIAIAEAAGFFCTNHAFVFGIEEDDQIGFTEVVGTVEDLTVLVGQAEEWDAVADGECFSVGALAAGDGG